MFHTNIWGPQPWCVIILGNLWDANGTSAPTSLLFSLGWTVSSTPMCRVCSAWISELECREYPLRNQHVYVYGNKSNLLSRHPSILASRVFTQPIFEVYSAPGGPQELNQLRSAPHLAVPVFCPMRSMGLVYLPYIYHKNPPNVGKYTYHTWIPMGKI